MNENTNPQGFKKNLRKEKGRRREKKIEKQSGKKIERKKTENRREKKIENRKQKAIEKNNNIRISQFAAEQHIIINE